MSLQRYLACFALLISTATLQAKSVTPLQTFFLVRQAFPQATEVSIFISKADFAAEEDNIKRATVQFKLKANVYLVANTRDVGNALKQVREGTLVVIFESESLDNSDTRLYVLSKCKEKKAAIVTTSQEYANSGALIGIYRNEAEELVVTLNLKKNEHYKERFTEEVIQKIGFKDVVL